MKDHLVRIGFGTKFIITIYFSSSALAMNCG